MVSASYSNRCRIRSCKCSRQSMLPAEIDASHAAIDGMHSLNLPLRQQFLILRHPKRAEWNKKPPACLSQRLQTIQCSIKKTAGPASLSDRSHSHTSRFDSPRNKTPTSPEWDGREYFPRSVNCGPRSTDLYYYSAQRGFNFRPFL